MKKNRKEVVAKFYDNFAKDYDQNRYSSDKQKRIDRQAKEVVLDLIGDVNDKIVLDCGCGTGRFADLFIQYGATVVGMDISENMVKIAKKKVPLAEFVIGDIIKMPFKEMRFDVVVCSQVLTHLHSYREPLLEMKRVTKENGTIIIDIRNSLWPLRPLQILRQIILGRSEYDPHHTHIGSIKKICKNIGLEIEEYRGIGFHFGRIKIIAPTLILKIRKTFN